VWLVVLIMTAMVARVILMATGVDELTTFRPEDGWLTVALAIFASVCAVPFAIWNWYASSQQPGRLWHLKRDRTGAWYLLGTAWTLIVAGVSGWAVGELAATGAQYAPGTREVLSATVLSVRPVSTPKTVCRLRLLARQEPRGQHLEICLQTDSRPRLGPEDLHPGDSLRILIKATTLGSVVLNVGKAGQG